MCTTYKVFPLNTITKSFTSKLLSQGITELNNLSKKSENVLGVIKGALSDLRQFVTTESPSKMMKNAFYFTSKAHFVLKIFKGTLMQV